MPKADFKDKQIEKLQAAIAKLEGQSGEAVEKVRDAGERGVLSAKLKKESACTRAAARFQQKIDVLEKQLKALGGIRG